MKEAKFDDPARRARGKEGRAVREELGERRSRYLVEGEEREETRREGKKRGCVCSVEKKRLWPPATRAVDCLGGPFPIEVVQ